MFNARPTDRRKTRAVAGVVLAGIGAVLVAIEAIAVRGQIDFAQHVMGLTGSYSYVVPVALEGATAASAGLTLWATLTGDPTFMHKVWTWIFLGAAVAANWAGALAAGRGTVGAFYLAFTCAGALHLWHALLQRVQRAELRAIGALEQPLPRFRLLRLAVAPRETITAWKLAIRHGIARPEDALAIARGELRVTPASTAAAELTVDLTAMNQREACEHAAEVIGSFKPSEVVSWLAANGIDVDPSNASKYLKRARESRTRELQLVTPATAAVEA